MDDFLKRITRVAQQLIGIVSTRIFDKVYLLHLPVHDTEFFSPKFLERKRNNKKVFSTMTNDKVKWSFFPFETTLLIDIKMYRVQTLIATYVQRF